MSTGNDKGYREAGEPTVMSEALRKASHAESVFGDTKSDPEVASGNGRGGGAAGGSGADGDGGQDDAEILEDEIDALMGVLTRPQRDLLRQLRGLRRSLAGPQDLLDSGGGLNRPTYPSPPRRPVRGFGADPPRPPRSGHSDDHANLRGR